VPPTAPAAANLVALAVADIPEIMRIERVPAYQGSIGTFTAEHHRAELASPDARYLGLRSTDGLEGFAILQEFRQPVVRLRRIAVAAAGRDSGTVLLRAVLDWAFGTNATAGG